MKDMKLIAELKINNYSDRAELAKIVAIAGYGVQIKERQHDESVFSITDYYVQIYKEDKMNAVDCYLSKFMNEYEGVKC